MTTATLVITALLLCISTYLFGLYVGRNSEAQKARARAEEHRLTLLDQRRLTWEHQTAAARYLQATGELNAQLASVEQTNISDRYTLLRAGHELELAARTFGGLNSPDHQKTAWTISRECFAIANRLAQNAPADLDVTAIDEAADTNMEAAA